MVDRFSKFLCRIYKRFEYSLYRTFNILLLKNNNVILNGKTNIYNKIYIRNNGIIELGVNVTITSGDAINPLCRVQRAMLYTEIDTSLIKIGNNVGMSSPCIWAKERIEIGDYTLIGGDCIIMDTDAHNLDWRVRAGMSETKDGETAQSSPIIIGKHCLIGTRSIILKGVTIGDRSVIGAGSVVTKPIPPDSIAAGNPCKVIKKLS